MYLLFIHGKPMGEEESRIIAEVEKKTNAWFYKDGGFYIIENISSLLDVPNEAITLLLESKKFDFIEFMPNINNKMMAKVQYKN